MKKYVSEFFKRGLTASGFGPMILAIIYLIIQHQGAADTLTINEVCLGIFSLSVLAFIAGGLNVLYQVDCLPLMTAIFIHGSVLYISYLGTYLINGWLEWGKTPILVFTGIFILGYLIVWAFIYSVTKRNTKKLNEIMKEKKQKQIEPSKG